jgi:hypothetical protein
MATTSEHELVELKRELAELAKQAERMAGKAREISDRMEQGSNDVLSTYGRRGDTRSIRISPKGRCSSLMNVALHKRHLNRWLPFRSLPRSAVVELACSSDHHKAFPFQVGLARMQLSRSHEGESPIVKPGFGLQAVAGFFRLLEYQRSVSVVLLACPNHTRPLRKETNPPIPVESFSPPA